MVRLLGTVSLIGLLGILPACWDGLSSSDVVGEYVLVSVNGDPLPVSRVYGHAAGTLVLRWWGRAERRVTFVVDQQGTLREYTWRGTFEVQGSIVQLALQEDSYVWTTSASVVGNGLLLTYPNPTDGDIAELYRRR